MLLYKYQKGNKLTGSTDGFKKRLMKRYPGMQGVYGEKGENLNIIKDPTYDAAAHGFGNIEFMFPGQDVVRYSDDFQYVNPTPDVYTSVYNPKGANKGDVFLDMMHGMRDDEGYQKLLGNFVAATKKGRGKDMDHWYNEDAKRNPNFVMDGRESWDNNFVDGILRAELANKTFGRRAHGAKDYKLERSGSTDEMREAAKDIKKYLKTKQPKTSSELPAHLKEYSELPTDQIRGLKKGGVLYK